MIFFKAARGIADGADDAGAKVVSAAHPIEYLTRERIHQQRVDGEVAAQNVLPGIRFKAYSARMASIGVGVIAAEGGHLDRSIALMDEHHPKVRNDLLVAGKQREHLAGSGARRGGQLPQADDSKT